MRKRLTLFSNEVLYRRELPTEYLFVREPDNPDTPGFLKPFVSLFVFLGIVAWTIDLDDEVECRQVEIRNPVVGHVETLLKTIGKTERSEVGAERVLGGRWPLFALGDENGVLLCAGELGEWNPLHDGHTRILIHIRGACRGKKNREFKDSNRRRYRPYTNHDKEPI